MQVVHDLAAVTEPVLGVLENIGGAHLAKAFSLVEPGGSVQSIGMASGQPTTIDFEAERRRGRERRLETFVVRSFAVPLRPGLPGRASGGGAARPPGRLAGGLDAGDEAVDALFDRRVAWKAVLTIE